jgi:cellulose synthase/poly-beta-1,6-N-acetylglucosamine synthase-like glycosyltransferase
MALTGLSWYATFATWGALAWCLALTIGYVVLGALAIRAGVRTSRDERSRTIDADSLAAHPAQPLVTVVVPAHDESASIALSVQVLLAQSWRRMEVIVVTNGCTDDTLDVLIDAFDLAPEHDSLGRGPVAIGSVRSAWRSTTNRNLRVIDIGKGGKADALNCGLERASGTFLCTMDADSLLATDAVARVVLPFVEHGSDVVAVGSVVRVLNGATIVDGVVTEPGLPRSLAGRMQVVEYARGFHLGRSGWAEVGALPIISGAFAAFRTSALRLVGGFRVDTVGEDMEVVLRLHHAFRPGRGRRSIVFVPRPLCWTEVPEDVATLRSQRMRWQHGLQEAASIHRRQMVSGTGVGMAALPFLAVLELFAPVIEVAGVLSMVLAMVLGVLAVPIAFALLLVIVALGVWLSALGILLEQVIGGNFLQRRRDVALLFVAAVLEQLGPRQRTAWWRFRALFGTRFGPAQWDGVEHHGAQSVATIR